MKMMPSLSNVTYNLIFKQKKERFLPSCFFSLYAMHPSPFILLHSQPFLSAKFHIELISITHGDNFFLHNMDSDDVEA